MRRSAGLALSVLVLAGCQGGSAARNAPVQNPQPIEEKVPPPVTRQQTEIALVSMSQPEDQPRIVQVGMTADDAFKAFPRRGGLEYTERPPKFGENYRARHWEDGRNHGFGVITFENKVVAAMYQEEAPDLSKVTLFVDEHQRRLGLPTRQIVGKRVTYWFWDKDGQRLMICALQGKDSKVELTASMGDVGVLDAIGASQTRAEAAVKQTGGFLDQSTSPGTS